MASKQPVQRHLSLVLSELLSDLGINDEMINRKQELALLLESLNSESMVEIGGLSFHFVGGLSDGSATYGERSEDDIVVCKSFFNVVQDLVDWRQGVENLLTIQDETNSPGYCKLQLIDSTVPRPATTIPNEQYVVDDQGKVLLKNTCEIHVVESPVPHSENGSTTLYLEQTLHLDFEPYFTPAVRCDRWPLQARNWPSRVRKREWPNAELISKCMETGFFLVPTGKFVGTETVNTLEWRISFSHAEMGLMFSMNAIQMGCYTLMKMLLESHIHQYMPDDIRITSYMCKHILFYCIEENALDVWQERHLIYCLTLVLQKLHTCVLEENCPDYFIPEKNHFQYISRRLVASDRLQLLYNIQYIINNIDTVLLGLKSEDIGSRLRQKLAVDQKCVDHDNKMGDVEPEGFNCDNGGIKAARSMNGASVNIVRRSLKFFGWCAVVYGWIYDV